MISLTRREFDAVSTALLEALADAKHPELRTEPGFRRRRTDAGRDPAHGRSQRRALPLVVRVH